MPFPKPVTVFLLTRTHSSVASGVNGTGVSQKGPRHLDATRPTTTSRLAAPVKQRRLFGSISSVHHTTTVAAALARVKLTLTSARRSVALVLPHGLARISAVRCHVLSVSRFPQWRVPAPGRMK
ncbi:hypothetical protein BGZ61DRAFT_438673 [Ilyonectria robusta]|uniref:uncharacterized protein n=1 Tax=Ilyonectria robusta TaxID=1079257 RepID=UPI001E8DA0DC|nr:uncharacterized protein BGZ61DRAFT_438673 [Ilyonectria robusta]KAH8737615.1 hypothetical protein BGZ61DRAFT_438673 [Ilyonectria robusta]